MTTEELCRKAAKACAAFNCQSFEAAIRSVIAPEFEARDAEIENLNEIIAALKRDAVEYRHTIGELEILEAKLAEVEQQHEIVSCDGAVKDVIDENRVLKTEIDRLKEVIRINDLCHDKDQKVGPREYADGCSAQQRKLFGCAPDADRIAELERENAELRRDAERLIDALRDLLDHLPSGYYLGDQAGVDDWCAANDNARAAIDAAIKETNE